MVIPLGDPVPCFSMPTLSGGSVDLHVDAGRWVAIAFIGDVGSPRAAAELSELLRSPEIYREDHLVLYGVLTAPPAANILAALNALAGPAINFLADYDGALSRAWGAEAQGRTILLDPLQRAVANIPFDEPGGHSQAVGNLLRGLPPPGDSAGIPLWAPVLLIPRVLEFPICDFLGQLYEKYGGEESGFLLDRDGRTETVLNPRLKRRKDMRIDDPTLKEILRDRVVRRVVPAMERFFQFAPTRMDRHLISGYEAGDGGHFFRHRDNVNEGARHRRFAMTLGLNKEFEGGGVRFPEFGPQTYKVPVGAALVFSTGILHEVLPVTSGRRLVFVPFLYGEEDAELRLRNNALLAEGSARYEADSDRLFPPAP